MVVLSSRAVASKPDKPDASSALLVSFGQDMCKSPIPLFNHDICAGLRGNSFFFGGGAFGGRIAHKINYVLLSAYRRTHRHTAEDGAFCYKNPTHTATPTSTETRTRAH